MIHSSGIRNAAVGSALVLLLAGCGREPADDSDRRNRGTAVAAIELSARDLSRRVVVSAPVEPRVHIRLASRTSGTVKAIHHEEGDQVEAGRLLAELDMSEQQAELRRAEAQEERARLEYDRMRELHTQDNVSLAEYQRARADLRIAESEREIWQTRTNFGRILAPRDAVITQRNIEPGEAVQEQDTLFELSALDQLVIKPGLSELDVVHLLPGETLTVRLDALPDLKLEGEVRRIFPSARASSRLVTVEISLPGDAAEKGVRPGFLARLEMDIGRRSDVLALPSSIVGSDDERGGHYVYVIEDEHLKHREVTTGMSRDGWTEIVEGLEKGETILASNPIDMRDGQQVRIVERR